MVRLVVGESKPELHVDKVVSDVDCASPDSEVVKVANRSEDFEVSDFELVDVSKTGGVVDSDGVVVRGLGGEIVVRPKPEFDGSSVGKGLVRGFFEVSLVRVVDVVEGLD